MNAKPKDMPVMQAQCATCAFRPQMERDDPGMVAVLKARVLDKGSLHCHSTGHPVGTHLCRGARDWQIRFFWIAGVLDEPTDDAWDRAVRAMQVMP